MHTCIYLSLQHIIKKLHPWHIATSPFLCIPTQPIFIEWWKKARKILLFITIMMHGVRVFWMGHRDRKEESQARISN